MDETAVWHDMLSNTTVTNKGTKSVVLKTTGHEKSRMTVVLASQANGGKLKPCIVFPGHKREVEKLKKDIDIKNLCFVESTSNGRMNEDTTIHWINNVLKTFTFGSRRLFAWDSYRAHLTDSVKELMSKGKIDQVIIPGGATGHIQAPDVSWNKPMKDKLRELYDQWMEEGPHATTKGGNMRGSPLKSIIQWIIKAWSNLDREILVKSFRCCALALAPDGSEDNEIACFKPGKTLASGLERLNVEDNPSIVIDDDDDDESINIEI